MLVLLAGVGGVLLGHDAQLTAEQLVLHLHLDPARGYPQIFVEAAGHLTNTRLQLLAGGALLYAAVRFTEAYGLWRGHRWATWVALIGAALYLPFDLFQLWHRTASLTLALVVINLAIVAYLGRALLPGYDPGRAPHASPGPEPS